MNIKPISLAYINTKRAARDDTVVREDGITYACYNLQWQTAAG